MTGSPAYTWLLCLEYVCFILNRMALESLKWHTPFEPLTGSTPDISIIYRFKFWDSIYFQSDDSRDGLHFLSCPNECSGKFVGFLELVGHSMTYKILSDDTGRIIYRSQIKLTSED